MNYAFFDGNIKDYSEDVEYDIQGKEHDELIRVCFQYSDTFSVLLGQNIPLADKLKPFEITVADPDGYEYAPPYYFIYPEQLRALHFYRICPELYTILTDNIHSIWEWIDGWDFKNPENPHFYRADGTCFFMCNTHDGECFFYAREDEDVSVVVNKEHWYREDELWPNAIVSPRPKRYRPLTQEKPSDH